MTLYRYYRLHRNYGQPRITALRLAWFVFKRSFK